MLHHWEEPCISGECGSGVAFFSGCPLACVFCQNHYISRGGVGEVCTPERLAKAFRELESQGAHNINLATGTHFAHQIIKALRIHRPGVPVVWNSGGYERPEIVDALSLYIDVWLPDFKYALSDKAERYSGAADYPEITLRAIERMKFHAPENIMEDGIIKRGVIIRHLVLPGNTRNSIEVLRLIAEHFPGTPVSLMSQYIPSGDAGNFPEINRRLTAREYAKVTEEAIRLGLDGYIQDISAASEIFVPDF